MSTNPNRRDITDGQVIPTAAEPSALQTQGLEYAYGPRFSGRNAGDGRTVQLSGGGNEVLDAQNRVRKVTDANGYTTTLDRDASGAVSGYHVVDRSNRTVDSQQRGANGHFNIGGLDVKSIDADARTGAVRLTDTRGIVHESLPQGNAIRVAPPDMPPMMVPSNGSFRPAHPVLAEMTPTKIKSEYHYAQETQGNNRVSDLDRYTVTDRQGRVTEMGVRNGQNWTRYRANGPGDSIDPSNPERWREHDRLEVPTRVFVDGNGSRVEQFPTGEMTQTTPTGGILHRHVDGLHSRTEPGPDGAQHLVECESRSSKYGLKHEHFNYGPDGQLHGMSETTDVVDARGQKHPQTFEYERRGNGWFDKHTGAPAGFDLRDNGDGSVTFHYHDNTGKPVVGRTLCDDGSEVIAHPVGGRWQPTRVLTAAGAEFDIGYDARTAQPNMVNYQWPNGRTQHVERTPNAPNTPAGWDSWNGIPARMNVDRYGTISWQFLNRNGQVANHVDDPRNIPPPEVMQQQRPMNDGSAFPGNPPAGLQYNMSRPQIDPRMQAYMQNWYNPDGSMRRVPRDQMAQ